MAKEETKVQEVKVNQPKIRVSQALPTQEIKEGVDEAGNKYVFYTQDEAIAEILTLVREIKKGVSG